MGDLQLGDGVLVAGRVTRFSTIGMTRVSMNVRPRMPSRSISRVSVWSIRWGAAVWVRKGGHEVILLIGA